MRSWPWTLVLACVVLLVLLLGLIGYELQTSPIELIFSLIVIAAALVALFRVLTSGVYVMPTGVIIRELTRSTPVLWQRVRSITCAPSDRRRVHAPFLDVLTSDGTPMRVELTILASYHESVARRRTQELVDAWTEATGGSRSRSKKAR